MLWLCTGDSGELYEGREEEKGRWATWVGHMVGMLTSYVEFETPSFKQTPSAFVALNG